MRDKGLSSNHKDRHLTPENALENIQKVDALFGAFSDWAYILDKDVPHFKHIMKEQSDKKLKSPKQMEPKL